MCVERNHKQEVKIIKEDFIEQESQGHTIGIPKTSKGMFMIPRTRAFRNGGFEVRVDVP